MASGHRRASVFGIQRMMARCILSRSRAVGVAPSAWRSRSKRAMILSDAALLMAGIGLDATIVTHDANMRAVAEVLGYPTVDPVAD